MYIFVYFVSVSFQAHSSQAKATLHILSAAGLCRVSSRLPKHIPYPGSCWKELVTPEAPALHSWQVTLQHVWCVQTAPIVCAPALLLPGNNNSLHKQPLLLVKFQTQRTWVQSTGMVTVALGVGIESPASSKNQNQLLQMHENVELFPKIVSPALLLSQAAQLAKWLQENSCPWWMYSSSGLPRVTWMCHFWVFGLSAVPWRQGFLHRFSQTGGRQSW